MRKRQLFVAGQLNRFVAGNFSEERGGKEETSAAKQTASGRV
jgi:hypothetical protein